MPTEPEFSALPLTMCVDWDAEKADSWFFGGLHGIYVDLFAFVAEEVQNLAGVGFFFGETESSSELTRV